MARYLLMWELDPTKVPVDPKERAKAWGGLIGLVKQDMERGRMKDWGAIPGELGGYTIAEANEVELTLMLQQYSPFVRFTTRPVMTMNQTEDMLRELSKRG